MSCLLVIDMQKGFINNYTEHLVDKIDFFISTCTIKDVVFTKFINSLNSAFSQQLNWHKLTEHREQEIVLSSIPTVVFKKNTYTAVTPSLINYLRSHKIDCVHICGIDTDSCVLKTALDIFDIGLRPIVIEDLCMSSAGNELHISGIKILQRNIGQKNVVNSSLLMEKKKIR